MSDDQTPPTDGPGGDADDALDPTHTAYGLIEPIEIEEEMERSFLDYSMSVIVSRALPDVRDGLKPVHRRILWGMNDIGARPDRPFMKCARVTGDVMGKYHPHGDGAIYDALVRMAQPHSLRHPLVQGHGNFGSPDDGPAAARYTECRLAPLAMSMLADIDEDTVDFGDNYSGEFEEPLVLPSRFPNLLVNGSQGIAVGMATNIPPHNLGEIIDATTFLIDHPELLGDDQAQAGLDALVNAEIVKGPDFPTGALILGKQGILDAQRTGRGSIRMRAVAEIEEGTRGGDRIVITQLPYQVGPRNVLAKISELVATKEIEGISGANDDSSGGETRIVLTLKRDAPALIVLNNLYKRTPLQTSFAVNTVALVDGVPRTLNLRDALGYYLDHQVEVITRRSQFRLDRAKARAHIVEGLLKALDLIDEIIATIRASADKPAARIALQAEHILDMQLSRLTRLGRADLEAEMAELRAKIAELEAILADRTKLMQVI
ncbi:MAG TPA: DNA gyrase subunit A, partial [Iamia sp.]